MKCKIKRNKEIPLLKYVIAKYIIVLVSSIIAGWLIVGIISKWDKFNVLLGLPEKDKPDYFMTKYFDSHSKDPTKDEVPKSILLIEVGKLTSLEVANLILYLDSLNPAPAVIGLDILYSESSDNKADSCLIKAIMKCGQTHKMVLPVYYDDASSNMMTPFFYNSIINDSVVSSNVVFGSVDFDDPWAFSSTKGGLPTFVYLLAESYLDTKGSGRPDTTNLIINYNPTEFKVIKYQEKDADFSKLIKYKGGSFKLEDIRDKIVIIGTTGRNEDPLFMGFHVRYGSDDDSKGLISNRIPGLIAIAYQVNSLIELKEKQLKKADGFFDFFNNLVNFGILALYMIIYYFIEYLDLKWKDSSKKHRIVRLLLPGVRLVLLILAEVNLIRMIMPVVDQHLKMPNIMVAMIALPLVSCFNLIAERLFEIIGIKVKNT